MVLHERSPRLKRNGPLRSYIDPWWPLICRKSIDVQFLFNDALNIPCNAILEASINVGAVYYYIVARMLSFYRRYIFDALSIIRRKNFGDIDVQTGSSVAILWP